MTADSSDIPPDQRKWKSFFPTFFSKIRPGRHSRHDEPFDFESCANLEKSKRDMIQGIITLSSKNVREVMIPRVDVIALNEKTPLKTLVKTVYDAGHSRVPIFLDTIDNIAGILYVKDLLKVIIDRPRRFDLKKILHRPFFVPETMTLDDLLVEFKKKQLHLACVVDEYGGFSGIITLEDILEEIVGEIMDEFDDNEIPSFIKVGKGIYEVDSRITITDFNEKAGIELPSDEFDTIGGFVFDLFGKIPKKNESIHFENVLFKIKEIKGTRINRITVTVYSR